MNKTIQQISALTLMCFCLLSMIAGSGVCASQSNAKVDGPKLDLSAFEVSFEDDFTKPDIVAKGPFTQHAPGMRWIAHTPWNGDFGDARFADPGPSGPFDFSTEGLTITASIQHDGIWNSGLICSVDRDGVGQQGFTQRYGYFEMRAKLPDGPGVWPSFWLVGVDKSNGSAEIDVMEYYGKFPASFRSTLHLWRGPNSFSDEHIVDIPVNSLTQSYHDFGVLIEHDRLKFYLDRVQYLDLPTPPAFRQPMYLLANLALGAGYTIDGLQSPTSMHIAYIRVYREKGALP